MKALQSPARMLGVESAHGYLVDGEIIEQRAGDRGLAHAAFIGTNENDGRFGHGALVRLSRIRPAPYYADTLPKCSIIVELAHSRQQPGGRRSQNRECRMALIVNEQSVAGDPVGRGARRQSLLNAVRVPGTAILLDRLSLSGGGQMPLAVLATSVAFLQGLEGEARLAGSAGEATLTPAHVVCLPPGFSGALNSDQGAALLYGEIPQASRFDADFTKEPPRFRISDWTREPVLDSEHDARKRIYLITPKLFGTKAVKGEMIIYPPGTAAANHHHEGAEHFMYVLRGRGTVYANEKPFAGACQATRSITRSRAALSAKRRKTKNWCSPNFSRPPNSGPSGSTTARFAPGIRPAGTSRAACPCARSRRTPRRRLPTRRMCE